MKTLKVNCPRVKSGVKELGESTGGRAVMEKQHSVAAILCLGFLLTSAGCGGGSGGQSTPTAPSVSVTVSPSSASLIIGQPQQFQATVSGTTNTAVAWLVNDVAGGNSTVGVITPAGEYVAPDIAPAAAVTVKAVSQADSAKSATSSVTVSVPKGTPALVWNKLINDQTGAGSNLAYPGLTIGAVDSLGNLVAAGLTPDPSTPPPSTAYISTAIKTDSAGNTQWTFVPGTGISGVFTTSDDSVVFSTGNGFLGLSASGQKIFLNNCGANQGFGEILEFNQTIYMQAANNSLMTSDLNGNINCGLTIPLSPPANSYYVSGFSVGSNYTILAGTHSISTSCWSGDMGYLQSEDMSGNPNWLLDFASFAAPQIIVDPLVMETTEGSTTFVYVTGSWFGCDGHTQYVTLKLTETGDIVWRQLWDDNVPNGDTTTYPSAILPDPKGGVIVVGSFDRGGVNGEECGLVSYTTSGAIRWESLQAFSRSDRCSGAFLTNDGKYMYALGVSGLWRGFNTGDSLTSPTALLIAKFALPQ